MAEALRSISCPSCAGPLAAPDGDSILTCQNCGNDYLPTPGKDYSIRYLPVSLPSLRAVGAAKKWLAGNQETPKDMIRAVFTQANLLFIPIWLVEAYVVGWEFGKKTRARQQTVMQGEDEYVTVQLVEEGVQEGSFKLRRFYQAGTDLSRLGIGRPQMSGREPLLPYAPGELDAKAALLEADRDYEEVREQARSSFRLPPRGSSGYSRFDILMEKTILVYYPLWSLHYRYQGRLYQMTVDGRTGDVHSARAPADNTRPLAALLASYALLAVALAVVVWIWTGPGAMRVPAGYLALLIAVLAAGAFWRFRLIREVEYHEPFSY